MNGVKAQTLSGMARQQTKASLPPGFSAFRILANAAPGSAKNMTPNREVTTSYSGLKEWFDASASTNCAGFDAALARARATPSIGAEISRPVTAPCGPAASANAKVVVPQPQPMSSTFSPGL